MWLCAAGLAIPDVSNFQDLSNLEDGGTVFLQNLRSDSHSNTVSHPRRHEFSARPLWKPQILCNALWVSLNSVIMVRVKFCWDGKPCNQMDKYQHFRDTYCMHLQFTVTLRGLEFI